VLLSCKAESSVILSALKLPVGQSYKTVGSHIEPMQHQKTHFNTLLAKAKLHSRLLASSSCQAPHTWIYYYLVYLRSIGYSLPVSHLFFTQLNKLQQPIVPVVLSKMGYCSNPSRILTFLCSFYGGIDFRDLRLEQKALDKSPSSSDTYVPLAKYATSSPSSSPGFNSVPASAILSSFSLNNPYPI
jgi:hypothetical protein